MSKKAALAVLCLATGLYVSGCKKGGSVVGKNSVVSIHYTLTVDNKIADKSEPGKPLEYIHGTGMIVPGLEEKIEGRAKGEKLTVDVTPEKGYGALNKELYKEIPLSAFPKGEPLTVGMPIEGKNQQGQVFRATVTEVKKKTAVLNFNHPLAGKNLHFEIEIADVKKAG